MSRNKKILSGLIAAASEGHLHHAYIFAGPESPAKLECVERLAAHFSAGLFADAQSAFERIQRGNHPDFLRLKPSEGLISVDEVRTLPKALAYPPLEASKRVVVLEGAEGMNVQAANALLKILEEPPAHTMFVLLCREPSELLPTVVSRCQVLRFAPLSNEELGEVYGERADASLLSFSEGSLQRASLLLDTEGGTDMRRAACENLLDLWEASPRIPSAVFQWVEGLVSEENCQIALDSWELMLRDLTYTAAGAPGNSLRFPEFRERLAGLAGFRGDSLVDEASRKTGAINRFRVYRQFNGNLRLDFSALLAELQLNSVGKAKD